jgi:hypothetical protein
MKYLIESLVSGEHISVSGELAYAKGKYTHLTPLLFYKKGDQHELTQEHFKAYARGLNGLAVQKKISITELHDNTPKPIPVEPPAPRQRKPKAVVAQEDKSAEEPTSKE